MSEFPAGDRVTRSFPATAGSVPLGCDFARAWLTQQLRDDPRAPDLLGTANTIIAQLLSDAVLSAPGRVELVLSVSPAAEVFLAVRGQTESAPGLTALALQVIDAASREWGIDVEQNGQVSVWVVLAL